MWPLYTYMEISQWHPMYNYYIPIKRLKKWAIVLTAFTPYAIQLHFLTLWQHFHLDLHFPHSQLMTSLPTSGRKVSNSKRRTSKDSHHPIFLPTASVHVNSTSPPVSIGAEIQPSTPPHACLLWRITSHFFLFNITNFSFFLDHSQYIQVCG
jgi:hypothetical protein